MTLAGALALIFGAISVVLSFLGLGKSFSPLISPRKANSVISTGMFQVWAPIDVRQIDDTYLMSCDAQSKHTLRHGLFANG